MCTERVVKRDVYPKGAVEAGGGELCGGGNRGQKNTRFFAQVNISARGPCLTGNAPSDPFWTRNWEGSCLHTTTVVIGVLAPGAPTIVREENYFIFHVRWRARATGCDRLPRWDIFSDWILLMYDWKRLIRGKVVSRK